jgi:hypothetical protein
VFGILHIPTGSPNIQVEWKALLIRIKISARIPTILTKISARCPQMLHKNFGIVVYIKLGHNRFLLNHFQLTIPAVN